MHKAKPVVCALFPLGRFRNEQTKKITYHLQNGGCGARNQRQTVKEWLTEFDITESEQAFHIWSDFVSYTTGLVEFIKDFSEKTKQMIYTAFFSIVYLHYDTDKDFLPQLEQNTKSFKELMGKAKGGEL